MNRLRQIGRHTLNLATGNILVTALGLVQNVLIANYMGASTVGMLGIAASYSIILSSIAGFRTSDCLTKYLVEYRLDKKQGETRHIFSLSIALDLVTHILALAVYLVSLSLANSFLIKNDQFVLAFIVTGATTFLSCLDSVWFSLMRDEKKYKTIAIFNTIFAGVRATTICALGLLGHLNLKSYVVLMILVSMIRLTFIAKIIRGISTAKFGNKPRISELIKALKEYKKDRGFWVYMKSGWFSTIISSVVKNGDSLILGLFSSTADVGVYKTARSMLAVVQSAFANFTSVMYQEFNVLVREKKVKEIKNLIRRSMGVIFLGGAAFWICSLAFSGEIIKRLYGPDFEGTSMVLNIQLVGVLASFCLYWVFPLGLSLGLGAAIYRNSSAMGVISILLMFVGGWLFGMKGLSVMYALAWGIPTLINLLTLPIIRALNEQSAFHAKTAIQHQG